jgi:hypothetical protein
MYVNGNMTHVHTVPKTKRVNIKNMMEGVNSNKILIIGSFENVTMYP